MLQVTDLHVPYSHVQAVQRISFRVERGEFVGIVGANGAGKSSVMLALMGMVQSTGQIQFNNQSIAGQPPEAIVRKGISLVPEGRNIFASLTVLENLLMGATVRNDSVAVKRDLDRMMTRFPILGTRRNAAAGTLSGGEQQQLAIARALMSDPKLLLVDEPSLGLAPLIIEDVYAILSELQREGRSILVVDQNVHRLLRVAHRIYVLRHGAIGMSGRPAELARTAEFNAAYFGFDANPNDP